MNRIYLDHNATTPIDPRVAEVMIQELLSGPRNPSSIHFFGQEAKKSLMIARQTIAHFLKVKPHEIIFTSSGTESLNLLIQGSLPKKSSHLITTDLDHPCIYENMKALKHAGYDITFLSPGLYGAPTPEQVANAIQEKTSLIVLSAANAETGVKLDLEGIAHIAESFDIPLIIDGVALLGKERFIIPSGVTGMGFSAHKIYGPKGVGFIYSRSKVKLSPLLLGGAQEYQLRGGTENLPGILGLAKSISLLNENLESYTIHMEMLRNCFENTLKQHIYNLKINGKGPRVSNTSNLCFPGVDGESLLIHLDMAGIAASHASACSSGSLEVSRVLLNMGMSKSDASSSLRFSFSHLNTKEEVLQAAHTLLEIISNYSLEKSK